MKRILICLVLVAATPAMAWAQAPTAAPTEEVATTAASAVTQLEKNKQDILDKEKEIAELETKIKALQGKRDTTVSEAELIASQVARLKESLAKAELEVRQTNLSIAATVKEQKTTEQEVAELQQEIETTRQHLRALLRELYQHEQESLIKVFLSNFSLSDVLAEHSTYEELQQRTIGLIKELREREEALHAEQEKLEQQRAELQRLNQILVVQQEDLVADKAEQQQFLNKKKAEQAEYEHLLADAKQAREEIAQQVFSLKSAGVTVKLNDAFEAARYAGKLTGVRPALLLAVLKVETNLGKNLGSGKFPDDMQPASREPFLRLTKKLGIDPYTAPISARPRSFQGWGGAMGPAQFMPQTWEGLEARIAQVMNTPVPDPYELTDAFVATAMLLADKGATQGSGEYEAVNRYIAGPNWQRFTWYGDRVLAVAKEYEKEGV